MGIKYVVLSDLHLGEEDGILTNLYPGRPEVDPLHPSPVMNSLAEALETLLERNREAPYLVILGDGLELALARTNEAVMVFERLLEEFFVKRGLFKGLIFIPGNHDHHLWETAREIQFARYLASGKLPPGEKIPKPWHISKMFADEKELLTGKHRHFVPSPLLESVCKRFEALKETFVGLLYPCFALLDRENRRLICFHHGHLLEGIYRLMSRLRVLLFDGEEPQTLDEIEEENFAWIDFFWSTMGRSGKVGDRIERIYEHLLIPTTLKEILQKLATEIAKRVDIPLVPERWEDDLLNKIFQKMASESFKPERHEAEKVLSKDLYKELRAFINGPLIRKMIEELQISKEKLSNFELTFVFGHTHKPFASLENFAPFKGWSKVYNTGGWVVDRYELLPRYGANMVLVSDDYDVCGVNLFRQGENRPVCVEYNLPSGEEPSPFQKEISQKLLHPSWEKFQREVQGALAVRAGHLRRRLFGEELF